MHALRYVAEQRAFAPEKHLFELELRRRLEGSYRIVSRIEGHTVGVLQLRHSARRLLDGPDEQRAQEALVLPDAA